MPKNNTAENIIIHVDGVQGSGKSYICKKLRNIKCFDTDDIATKAFNKIENSQKTNKKIPRTLKNLEKISNDLVNNIIKKNNIVVFVGMTIKINNPTYKLFIKINDLTETFKRFQLRELDKIINNENIIKKAIKEMTPEHNFIHRKSELSWHFPVGYNEYKKNYNILLKEAKKKGYDTKTQNEIIEIINYL